MPPDSVFRRRQVIHVTVNIRSFPVINANTPLYYHILFYLYSYVPNNELVTITRFMLLVACANIPKCAHPSPKFFLDIIRLIC